MEDAAPPRQAPRSGAAPASVRLDGISKRFGHTQALFPTDLEIEGGDLVALLGPSGCGKTTTLRIIAGFEAPDTGRVTIGGRDLTPLPPNKRGLGMVFQNYSLFPHMTVGENIAFGLEMARLPAGERAGEVRRMLEMVRLPGIEDRFPKQLSGGQQQRVALARALVTNPSVLLLDEPLGALDKNLRESMQFELRRLQQSLGITTLLVTHDQEEALTMSDVVVVMDHGRVVQIGTPGQVYERPRTRFVSDFLGTSNILEARLDGPVRDGRRSAVVAGGRTIEVCVDDDASSQPGAGVLVAVRPEKTWLAKTPPAGANALSGTLVEHVFRGTYHAFQVDVPGLEAPMMVYQLAADVDGSVPPPGSPVDLCWKPENAVILAGDAA